MKTNWGFSTECKLNIMKYKLNIMQCKLNMSCKFEELKLSVRIKWNEGSTDQ